MSVAIRPYHPSDLPALYRVALHTGHHGQDASQLFRDGDLLGHVYVAPYAVLEPELAFVLVEDGAPCGYILGTADSARFGERCEQAWYPALRARYPLLADDDRSADAELIRHIHAGYTVEADLEHYPAHLHIDLLPVAQGQGWGGRLMATLLERLRALSVPGVHLGVSMANPRAIRFYTRQGFSAVHVYPNALIMGLRLS
ncbi:MAG: GNAT family N-acetyltransferase [Caldilineaceae bacterium]|nr:GNAT family N-acetyltransferase [Caldilineaceae bacterium]